MVPFRSHLAAKLKDGPEPLPEKPGVVNAAHFPARLRLAIVWLGLGLAAGQCAEPNQFLAQWLQAQTNLQTWSAQVVQTRHLKTLTQPLVARGQVWFSAPNLFRWEIGRPTSTIAIRQPEQMLVIYPRLRRAEKFPLHDTAQGPWKEILALLEAGFPRSRQDVDQRFDILDQSVTDRVCTLSLRPKSPAARHMMPRLQVSFSIEDFSLRATELEFADGSTMRNEFHDAVLNPDIDPQLFQPELPETFTVAEPDRR